MGSHVQPLRPWRQAWHDALYAINGFYSSGPGAVQHRSPDPSPNTAEDQQNSDFLTGPTRHFRTNVTVGPQLARVIANILSDLRVRLGHQQIIDVIDIGAGDGTLLQQLRHVLTQTDPDLAGKCRFTGVDVHVRPHTLDPEIEWVRGLAPEALQLHLPAPINGLVIAHEWLDNIPCDVIESDHEGQPRVVLVDQSGNEELGPSLWQATACANVDVDAVPIITWLKRWWPSAIPGAFSEPSLFAGVTGSRAEVGISRESALCAIVRMMNTGTLLAIDYAHDLGQRTAGQFARGSLTGYRDGRQVRPVPDGTCDITAHVALDACGAAVLEDAQARGTSVSAIIQRQSDVLRDYGIEVSLPSIDLATTDPAAYADKLVQATEAQELTDPASLGSFQWLRIDIG